ncbi:hypothetical protein Q428_08860 [Fervidicella metallireducens AeB]|uniref:Uncharacterized protein n=1 Tax=Fervidicella metallireducens AeB TaxID=1403537 RepID=A0A017RUJ6_9CLOT|nr:hypothetical protein [Fervidicella metallireducens]EYE88301.1 hypothetical protein Q428_08860 [Fervidicella metallireducens AeB]
MASVYTVVNIVVEVCFDKNKTKEADYEEEVQSQLKDGISKFGVPNTVHMAEDKKQLREANERLNKLKLRIREFCRGNINTR